VDLQQPSGGNTAKFEYLVNSSGEAEFRKIGNLNHECLRSRNHAEKFAKRERQAIGLIPSRKGGERDKEKLAKRSKTPFVYPHRGIRLGENISHDEWGPKNLLN